MLLVVAAVMGVFNAKEYEPPRLAAFKGAEKPGEYAAPLAVESADVDRNLACHAALVDCLILRKVTQNDVPSVP